jgi:glycosyltransferase involved in cell wall biosynthesis
MSDNTPPALLIIDEGSLVHNARLIGRIRHRFDLTVRVRNKGRTRLAGRRELVAKELLLLAELLVSPGMFRRRSLLICSSGHYAALVASRLLGVLHREVDVFLYNFYLHGLGRKRLIRRFLSSLLTERVAVVAQSEVDLEYFGSLSSRPRLLLVPYCQDPVVGIGVDDVALGNYVFAGGYTNRDYDGLLQCARRLHNIDFIVACSSLNRIVEPVPENVDIRRDLDLGTFHRLLAGARLVVIPLADDVGASGQMVTLAAMQLGKATVMPNSPSIAQYVENGVSGVVYDRSDTGLCNAIRGAYDDESMLLKLGAAAREQYYSRFKRASFDDPLVEALDEVSRVGIAKHRPGTSGG